MVSKKFIKRLCSRANHGLWWCRNVSRRCVYGCVKAVVTHKIHRLNIQKVNLCCGPQRIPGYFGTDFCGNPDLKLNLAKYDLPFKSNSLSVVICISAINYFKRARAEEIVGEVHRVLKVGGVARFGVQDMESIARRYVEKDREFFFQKLPNGKERFEGATLGDKFAAWFYGYAIKGVPCQYFYDYESLAHMFKTAGFSVVERKAFQDSSLENIHMMDNRPDQMFFLEAVK
jgi:predicted SAM-dependent methyltransferase